VARQFTRQASYTETLQIANRAAASGPQAMVLARFSLLAVLGDRSRFAMDFLRCSMISQCNSRFFAKFAGLHAMNLFAPRKNIGPADVEGLHAPRNCRIENL
jgi:hypothetical protein